MRRAVKIELEIPDWVLERHLYILAGIELVAFKNVGELWKVKTGRCSVCGKCCVFKSGPCEYLKTVGNEVLCGLGIKRPLNCSMSAEPFGIEGCTEKFEEI